MREGTQGYQLRLETAPVLLGRFLISGVEQHEARGDRKGGVRVWRWGEAHRVRFFPRIAAVLSSGPPSMERTRDVLLYVLYSYGCLRHLHLSILSRVRMFYYREHSCRIS